MPDRRGERRTDPLLPGLEHELTVPEVRLLWSFVHGDIMSEEVRRALRRSWGPCDRHAWGHAVVEIELWQAGAGRRAGHQPFDVSILYADLCAAMASALRSARTAHARVRVLLGDGTCPICRDLAGPDLPGLAIGYAGSDSGRLTSEANVMRFTANWLKETAPEWLRRACPDCAVEAGRDPAPGQQCRRHLAGAGSRDADEPAEISGRLDGLASLLERLVQSMTDRGEPSTPEADAAWVEALGWFHGWRLPFALAPRE